ncbi:nucleotide sugar dehydrogenase [Bacteroidota bacterium]
MVGDLKQKKKNISVIGLGYVGLPIALEFAKKYSVIGFDINQERIELMKKNIDPSKELDAEEFENCDILFTSHINDLADAHFHIVAVPTPIDDFNMPDLQPVISASETVGSILKKGDYVVFESTVYPGCTEEECVPILEKYSGLKYIRDFKVGYSPERINPGDKVHTLTNITKVTSGCDEESAREIGDVYESIITAGIYRTSSIKVAEAAKIIENTQRDINIAFMNELSIIFGRMGINTYEVLEAAGTKWNFLNFYPGLVGGHCIGVDPYYLTYKARKLGYHAQIITAGRFINDSMGGYVAKQVVKRMLSVGKIVQNCKVLIMGVTFKEDVSDIRNSKVFDLIRELESYQVRVEVVDPHAEKVEVEKENGVRLMDHVDSNYDSVIVAVSHNEYKDLDESFFKSILNKDASLIDLKGIYRGKIKEMPYWSL